MKTKITYYGFLKEKPRRGNDYAFFIGDVLLAEKIQEDIENFGKYLSVCYWISDKERSKEEISERFTALMFGESSAEYKDYYSEATGYLWTDEECNIGGHDLIEELRQNLGKYCILEIEFNGEPLKAD